MIDAPSLLGPNPDLEDVELIQAVEAAFDVRLTSAEVERMATVGDLHNALIGRVQHVERGAIPCPTAIAFRRLRRAIEAAQPGMRVRPSTELALLAERGPLEPWWRAASSGLRLPARPLTLLSGCLVLSLLAAPLALLPILGVRSLLGWLVLLPLVHILAPRLPVAPPSPSRYRTVGDLARIVAAMNVRALSGAAGVMRTSDVWATLDAVIREQVDWKAPISPETRLIG